ncbi:DnaA regulatory inactivator Hda [Achromobacter sp. DMS1]|uniref:DnaA regulatory inactivator Hda n=1 Tax=Achromobacter sp. DMS1 TaxID=1688405 RepID=UPI0009EB0732|nr:DnaA regulatory inactivator Hda [Achromobacter sp. DMS1]
MNRQLLLDVLPAPAPSLNNYIAGPNGEALAAVRALAPGRALYIWGRRAAGAAICCARSRPAPTRSTSTRRAARACCASWPRPIPPRPCPSSWRWTDVYGMDERRQAGLFALYNRWRESAATGRAFALAVAGDRAPLSMPLREDLRTRLGWDLVFRLDPLSDADKLAALSAQAAERGMQLAPEIINWMLTHHERDIRKLAALVDALDRYSLATGRPITLPLLRAMLADPDSQRT